MSCFYSAFGLGIQSDLPVPGLEPRSALPSIDVNIWQAAHPDWMGQLPVPTDAPWRVGLMRDQQGAPLLRFWKFSRDEATFMRLRYQSGNEFLIDTDGRNIWVVTGAPRSPEHNALYLLGPILTLTLRLRGVVCLHASAVVIDDWAIAFVGAPEAGKSTTAAAFARAGYRILTDDTVALSRDENAFVVRPGYPRLRLWAESAAALYESAEALPVLAPDFPKQYLELTRESGFQNKPTALGAIYCLATRVENSAQISIHALRPRQALINTIENTYGSYILDSDRRATEFRWLGELCARVPVLRVSAPDDLTKLDSFVDGLVRDFRSRRITGSAPAAT